jgi:hypothetical protein
MRIIRDGIWLCQDCTIVACNGPDGVELLDEMGTLSGLAGLGPHLVPTFDSETGEGIESFSRRHCDSCQEWRAGYRAEFATLGPEEKCI